MPTSASIHDRWRTKVWGELSAEFLGTFVLVYCRLSRVPGGPIRRPTILISARSESIGGRHPIQERPHAPLDDPEDELDEALLRRGVLQRARVDRLVARVSV